MIAILEDIAQNLAQEMESTGTIELGGTIFTKNSLNPSPNAGLCRPAVDKLASLTQELIHKSKVDRVSFITVNDDAWRRSMHVIAEITTEEGVFTVDPTIRQYMPDAKMVYAEGEQYPIEFYSGSINRSNIYNNI